MTCGPLPDTDHIAKYCGYERHQDGQPLEVAFQVGNDHISANWIEYFDSDIEMALQEIRRTCGLQLGPRGAYPVLPVQNVRQAIEAAGGIADIVHTPEGTNESHSSIAWKPRTIPVDRMVALQLSQQRWHKYPAVLAEETPEE